MTLMMQKILFSYNLPAGGKHIILSQKNFVFKFYFASIIQSAQHIYEKGKDPDLDLYL
jgi:hypothetical protein